MKSIFNLKDNTEFIARINSLSPDDKPQWGKMNVNQMIEHCNRPLEVALGIKKPKRTLIGILFGKMIKKKLVSPEPFGKNMPTDKTFIVSDTPDFTASKKMLINKIERLQKEGPAVLTGDPHPFFGKLNQEEWDSLMVKHLDHHLRQFKR